MRIKNPALEDCDNSSTNANNSNNNNVNNNSEITAQTSNVSTNSTSGTRASTPTTSQPPSRATRSLPNVSSTNPMIRNTKRQRKQLKNQSGYNSDDERVEKNPMTEAQLIEKLREQQEFVNRLKSEHGLEMVKTEPDGNCLFRAVALQVYGDAEMHDTVRQLVVQHLLAERHHYSQFITEDFDTYIARKAMNGVHGNNTELQAIGEMYNRPVEVYSDDNGGAKINLFHDEYVNNETIPLRLSYHGHAHYNALIDPKLPSIGVGLGLPGLTPTNTDQNVLHRVEQDSDAKATDDVLLKETLENTADDDVNDALLKSVADSSRQEYMAQMLKEALASVMSTQTTTNNNNNNDNSTKK